MVRLPPPSRPTNPYLEKRIDLMARPLPVPVDKKLFDLEMVVRDAQNRVDHYTRMGNLSVNLDIAKEQLRVAKLNFENDISGKPEISMHHKPDREKKLKLQISDFELMLTMDITAD